MNKKEKNNKGFSLVELIIVIAIMAILVGVLAPQFIQYVEKSRESTDIQNFEQVRTAVEAYVADHGETITNSVTVTLTNGPTGTITVTGGVTSDNLATYGIGTTKVKSSKWEGTLTGTYDTSGANAYKWVIGNGHATYYNLDGTPVTSTGGSGS